MNLQEARKEFEAVFVKIVPPAECGVADASIIEYTYSGGTGVIAPVLYVDKERSIRAWLLTALEKNLPNSILKWVEEPDLVKYQITMADNKRGHRIVSDRYAVRSKFIVETA